MQAAPWAEDWSALSFALSLHHLLEASVHSPANSQVMAFPMGCVAPVTTHTKPYCGEEHQTCDKQGLAYIWTTDQLAIRSVRREMSGVSHCVNGSFLEVT